MTHTLIQGIEKQFINKKAPILRSGYQVRVHQKITEGNKERIQIFEGLVISMNAGHGASKTFTVRKVVQGIGVEKIFPVYSPRIAKIEIKKTFKVRQSKLSYLKKAGGLSKRLSAKLGLIEKDQILKQKKGLMEQQEATMDEAVKKAEEEAKVEDENAESGADTTEATTEIPAEKGKSEAPAKEAKSETSSEESTSADESATEQAAKEKAETEVELQKKENEEIAEQAVPAKQAKEEESKEEAAPAEEAKKEE